MKNIGESWIDLKELSKVISGIKTPIWNEGDENFGIKGLIREFLQNSSGNKIIDMLKNILSPEEKTALVKNELDSFFQSQAKSFENQFHSFFQNQAKYFENHMKIKFEIKTEKCENYLDV